MPSGRPIGSKSGRKVALALREASLVSQHNANLKTIMLAMSERQQRLFTSLAKGLDELQAIVDAEMFEYVTGIAKIVYTVEGKPIRTSSLKTVKDLERLSPESYSRMLRIASSAVRNQVGTVNYTDYVADISWFFKLIAPDAALAITGLMLNEKTKPAIQLKAATTILNHAGYSQNTQFEATEMPVRVNIVMDQLPRPEGE